MDDQVREEVLSLVDTHPELRDGLRELLEKDAEGTWSFQDISLDSGEFGETVSRGIVEQTDDGYRLASREATAVALDVPATDPEATEETAGGFDRPDLPAVDGRRLGLLGVGLLCVVAVRTVFAYGDVFRGGTVVLSGNDAYMYYDAVRMLLVDGPPAHSVGGLSELTMDFLNAEIRTHDTLLVVVVWWVAAALGGEPGTVAAVLAWYPVVVAAVTAAAVYAITMRLTDDVRCGLAAVLFLAIIPAHVFRTSLGFGDHHAFDYLWLSLTVLSLLVVVAPRAGRAASPLELDRPRVAAIVLGGLAVAAQMMAWRGGPLFLLPVAFYAVGRLFVDLRSGTDPVRSATPLVALLAVGSVATLGVHLAFGWLQPYRALAPALVLAGVGGAVGVARLLGRFDLSARAVLAIEAAIGAVGLLAASALFPSVFDAAARFGGYLQRYGGSGITETYSIVSSQFGSLFGPVFLFGLTFFLGVAYLVWATWRNVYTRTEPGWLLLAAYSWWFLVLSFVQTRFAGALSLFVAVFSGIGFVHLAAWIDIVAPPSVFSGEDADRDADRRLQWPVLDGRSAAYLLALFVLLGGFAGVQSAVKINQTLVEDSRYEAGVWVDQYAEQHGLDYPDNYVLSPWGTNRADNYLISGETESYDYARRHYGDFLASSDPEGWYEQFREDRVGFVFVRSDGGMPDQSLYSRLYDHYGSRTDDATALSHYRAIYDRREEGLVVFEVVPGATVVGTADPGADVTAATNVTLPPRNRSVTYRTVATANSTGRYRLMTPYPGTYTVGNRTVTVSVADVRAGRTVTTG